MNYGHVLSCHYKAIVHHWLISPNRNHLTTLCCSLSLVYIYIYILNYSFIRMKSLHTILFFLHIF